MRVPKVSARRVLRKKTAMQKLVGASLLHHEIGWHSPGSGSGQSRNDALKQLGVSPQCGFASHEDGNLLGYNDMVNKLKLVRGIADDVWPGEP